jgi:hypothetical protein
VQPDHFTRFTVLLLNKLQAASKIDTKHRRVYKEDTQATGTLWLFTDYEIVLIMHRAKQILKVYFLGGWGSNAKHTKEKPNAHQIS